MEDQREVKIQVKNLSKHFGDLVVLDDISFDIHKGEFLCVVGPTGCGKTTFCNVVTSLLPVTAGSIAIEGEPIDFRKHNVAFVFQEPSCLPWRTVYDNIKIGLDIKNIPRREIADRVEGIMELTGLTKFRDFFPNQLSAGTKQRVVVARAFVTEPDMLLMDEPSDSWTLAHVFT